MSTSAADQQPALSAKAQRTRQRLLEAARVVFERDGFLNARVGDIAEEAGVAHGTFYTYFDSKQDVFRALLTDFMPSIYSRRTADAPTGKPTRIQRIERANAQFYSIYKEYLQLFALLEQATTYDEEIRTLRIRLRERAEQRVVGMVRDLQADGVVSRDLNAEIVASCLVAMATHSFYTWHITEHRDYDFDEANRTLTYLWASALGLTPEPADDDFYQSMRRVSPQAR